MYFALFSGSANIVNFNDNQAIKHTFLLFFINKK